VSVIAPAEPTVILVLFSVILPVTVRLAEFGVPPDNEKPLVSPVDVL